MRIRDRLAVIVLCTAACTRGDTAAEQKAPGASSEVCQVRDRGIELPDPAHESSGIAVSRTHPGVLWTHDDSGGPATLFAVDSTGRLLGQVRVTGARNKDWEDIARGPCASGGECLYVADTGDNDRDRKDVEVYRVPEPAPTAPATAPAEKIVLRYPGGARDAEALFVLPNGDLFLVTKGRKDPVEVYRAKAPLRTDAPNPLVSVAVLNPGKAARLDMVTGADATPNGRWVVIRTYTALHVFSTADLLRGGTPESDRVDLVPLGEPQGEAVAIRDDGTVFLTSESASKKEPAVMARLLCTLE